jgi:4-alpha-glucanotransferase
VSDANEVLRELSSRLGIVDWYWSHGGEQVHTTDDTRRAMVAAFGIDVSSETSLRSALADLNDRDAKRLIPPTRVVEIGDPSLARIEVRTPASRSSGGPWRLELHTDDGRRHVAEGPWRGDGTLEIALPHGLPIGYHRVVLSLSAGGEEWSDEQTLIIVPSRCVSPADRLGDQPAFGVIANLYTVRSGDNWGVGDFGDLASIATWAGATGADFVGVNPLHALLNRHFDISPYSPVSRLFRNAIYIDVARVPELADADGIHERLASPEFRAELDALRESPLVRYEQVMAVKGIALDALHRIFVDRVRNESTPRARAYRDYVDAHEPALTRFATWMTLAEHEHSSDWRTWSAELRTPESDAVERFANKHAHRIDFHRWVQFEADRQLADAAGAARDAGMRIGLYQDLAIGSSPAGADTWTFADLFVRGASAGAPPDPYSATGQNWGLPPLNPIALQRSGYRYFIDLIRSGFRNAGALRIDHVMGLFRLFWIPEGKTGEDGAYVRYPAEDLLGIIALESVRNNALVVGEDLGTVPDEVPPRLAKWGILSSKVLYFERDWHSGSFKPARLYPALALATANTHDMPTLAGFWSERDIAVRRQLGLIADDDEEARARSERDRDRGALVSLLNSEGIIPEGTPHSSAELRAAVHGFLWSTPAQLVGLSLDDLAGETEAVNVPGVGPDRYPCWMRKMHADLETITSSQDADVILARSKTQSP